MRIQARIADAEPFDRRQSARTDVEIGARVRELGNEGVEARVLNISCEGFMAETEGNFDVGTRIWLMLPNRERANALVKWTAGNKIGAEFSQPIDVGGRESGLN
ncbi:PilZ domain-containing protein [Sphingomonas rhizophila]|uniref:PilZ domain-containing protein n=1 Tax=Sphingomonas rhizophila TaxID=2071607 RepID=A0A7G9SAY8_9SPHN|nr:PilZ domain-containing protein [Sphingomonas rhizophila]QNN65013.1 PilZ domain-containing protein [Sphingomonas rhizophila]